MTRARYKPIAALWVLSVIAISLQPVRAAETIGRNLRHQAMHVVLFGFTELVLLQLARNRKEELNAIGAGVCLAAGIEVSQFLIYHLPVLEWWDIREDCIGFAAAWLTHRRWPLNLVRKEGR